MSRLSYFCITLNVELNCQGAFREVIPGATTPLTTSLLLTSLDRALSVSVQSVPGNPQQCYAHLRRYLPNTSHHVIFNYLDLVMQTVR